MPPLPEPIRGACPKCGHDLRGIELDGYDVVCPECGGRWEPWKLEYLGGRPRWLTPTILIGCGLGGWALCALTMFAIWPLLIAVFGLAALSDAPVSLGPFNVFRLGILAIPLALTGLPAFHFLRASYKTYNWPEPIRRARVRAMQLVAVQAGVLWFAPYVASFLLRLFG